MSARTTRGALAALALVFAAACAGSGSREAVTGRLRAVVGPAAGPDAVWVGIGAASSEAAWGEVVRARTELPLALSKQLARSFEQSEQAPLEIVAGGPYPQLVDQVLRDAFELARSRRLTSLRLVHVSPEPMPAVLVSACAERGATCVHVDWRDTDRDD